MGQKQPETVEAARAALDRAKKREAERMADLRAIATGGSDVTLRAAAKAWTNAYHARSRAEKHLATAEGRANIRRAQ